MFGKVAGGPSLEANRPRIFQPIGNLRAITASDAHDGGRKTTHASTPSQRAGSQASCLHLSRSGTSRFLQLVLKSELDFDKSEPKLGLADHPQLPMLELDNVSKSYGAVRALRQISLTVQTGRSVALIGPSGCGKSTILRLMIGLTRPDSGVVRFAGEPLRSQNLLDIRQKLGYVIQEGGLFPHMTVRQNVTLMARQLDWPPTRIEERLQELSDLAQLPRDRNDDYPAQLSGGQRQRVSLMRALMLDPEVLLLDEPLGALDPMIRYELQEDLKTIFDGLKKTVVLVTHDLGEAAFFADRIVLLRDGEIVQSGTVRELLSSPADSFVREFIRAQRSPLESADVQ